LLRDAEIAEERKVHLTPDPLSKGRGGGRPHPPAPSPGGEGEDNQIKNRYQL